MKVAYSRSKAGAKAFATLSGKKFIESVENFGTERYIEDLRQMRKLIDETLVRLGDDEARKIEDDAEKDAEMVVPSPVDVKDDEAKKTDADAEGRNAAETDDAEKEALSGSSWSDRLCELRLEHKMTLDDVALFLGISASAACKYESGARSPKAEHIIALCRLYGVSADYLLGLSDKR